MLPRLGATYENKITIEITSKPKGEYLTDDYFALDLPVAPAIMVGEEIVTEGKDVDDYTVEVAICRSLGLSEPAPPQKGFIARLFS